MTEEPRDSAGGGLPFSQGREFPTLDAYLAFLEQRGAMDVPWYREVEPGIYELVSGRGRRGAPVRCSRAELLARFGFAGEGAA